MKLVSPLPHRRGRLEIIPLIDIMFFLLAAFMLVSINKIKVKSLKVNLPTDVAAAQKEKKEDFISLSINADGQTQLDKELLSKDALLTKLQALYAQNHDQKFLISADQEARHGDVMRVLGKLRSAGFQKVAFSVKSDGGADAAAPVPAALGAVPPAPTAATAAPAPAPATPAPAATSPPAAAPTPAPATPGQ